MTSSNPRKLTRSRDHRIVAGVCGGVANYLNMDATLIRVVFVALTIFTAGTVGLLAYLVGVLVIPEESLDPDQLAPDHLTPRAAGEPSAPDQDRGFTTMDYQRPKPSADPGELR